MRWIKLGVFLPLVGALVAASLLLKDRLAERGLEAALEGVFRARADVSGLRLKLLGGRVEFRSLSVADEQEPMTNLFELGPTEAELNLAQLLRRKVVVESVACRDIRWSTPRSASGALPGSAAAPAARPGGGLALPGLDQIGFDPAALLAAEKAKLKSPAAYEQSNAALKASSERWQTRAAEVGQRVDKLGEAVETLRKIDFRSVKSVEEARRSYQAVEAIASTLADAQKDLKAVGGDFQTDLGKLRAGVSGANTLLQEDIRYVRSRITLPEGGIRGVVSSLARAAMEQKLGRFSSLAERALEAAGRMRDGRGAAGGARKSAPSRRAGRDVAFASTGYPSFLLKSFAFSVKPEGASLAGEIKDLSSNPELWGKPAAFRADYSAGGLAVQAGGEIDSREAAPRAKIQAKGSGLDFALAGLPWIGTAAGSFAFATTADVGRGGVEGEASVTTGAVRTGEAQNVAGRLVRDALAAAKQVAFDAGYKRSAGEFALTLRSNLDDEVSRQLSSQLAELKADYQKQAEAELRKSIGPELARAQEELGSLDRMGGQLEALDGRTEGYRKEIEAKKAEYSAALSRLGGGLLKIPGF